ncbi:hypothetical protein BGZ76_005313 [Entomortierella beljakovae]|nr:hypothetical protein BGZ76_005313 [Entomortierella beljakovae]
MSDKMPMGANDTQHINLANIDDIGKNGMTYTLDTAVPLEDLNNQCLVINSEKFEKQVPIDAVEVDSEDDEYYPEGGYGWWIVVAAFLVTFWTLGVGFIWGVFQAYFIHAQTFPGASPIALYWVGTTACSLVFLASPLIVILIHKVGRGLVLAIALMGSGIGSTSLAPLVRLMLTEIGFPWTMRILGFCMLFFLGLASAMVRPYDPVTMVSDNSGSEDSHCDVSSQKEEHVKPSKKEPVKNPVDFTLLRDKNYSLVLLGTAFFSLIYLVPILLLPSYASSIKLSGTQGAIMVSITTGVGTVTRVIVGVLSDRYGVLNATIICSAISVVSIFAFWLDASTYASVIAFSVVFGGFGGPSIMLYPVSASRIVPSSKLMSALGFIFMSQASGYLIGAPLAQWIVARQGDTYNGAIIFVGAMNILSTVIIIIVRLRISKKLLVAV